MFLILKLGEEEQTIDFTGLDLIPFIEALKKSHIVDQAGDIWIIDPNTPLFFDVKPLHFEIECKPAAES